jgi:hypothetical protein
MIPCTYDVLGEVDADLSRLLATEANDSTLFAVHSDSAPTFYVTGNPGQMDSATTRKLEHDVAGLTAFNPITGTDVPVTAALADQQEQSFLHMVTADSNRTPTFILFGDPNFFLFSSGSTKACSPLSVCSSETNAFAWNHGDFQPEITNTWLGLVGPGIDHKGATGEIFSDHTDIRPTIISLAGLLDDYTHDGRVVFEVLKDDAIPAPLRQHRGTLSDLAAAYKAINAPLGTLGKVTLQHATAAIEGSDTAYGDFVNLLAGFTQQRNTLAGQIIQMLEGDAFGGDKVDENAAKQAISQANGLISKVP